MKVTRNKGKTQKPSTTLFPGLEAAAVQKMFGGSGYDPRGKHEPVDISSSIDGWSEYTLKDGSVIRTKAALMDVKIAVGQYDVNGAPIYVVQTALVTQVKAPDSLKKG